MLKTARQEYRNGGGGTWLLTVVPSTRDDSSIAVTPLLVQKRSTDLLIGTRPFVPETRAHIHRRPEAAQSILRLRFERTHSSFSVPLNVLPNSDTNMNRFQLADHLFSVVRRTVVAHKDFKFPVRLAKYAGYGPAEQSGPVISRNPDRDQHRPSTGFRGLSEQIFVDSSSSWRVTATGRCARTIRRQSCTP